MFKESRLIGFATLQSFGNPTVYNSRTAQANADQQSAQHQAQLSANQAAGSTKATVVPVPKVATNPTLAAAQTTYAAQANGQQTSATSTAQVGDSAYLTAPKTVAAVPLTSTINTINAKTVPSQIHDINSSIEGLRNGMTASTQNMTAEERAAYVASVETQISEKMKQKQMLEQNARDAELHTQSTTPVLPPAAPVTPEPTTTSEKAPEAPVDPNIDPGVQAAYQDVLNALQTGNSAAATAALQRWTELNNDTSVADAAAQSKIDLKENKNQMMQSAEDEHQVALDRAAEIERQEEFDNANAKAQFELDQAKVESDQREKNAEAEQKNRNIAASLGINHDTNGLKWMATEARKGSDMLVYLEESGSLQKAHFAEMKTRIVENYRYNASQADLNWDKTKQTISSNYQEAIKGIDATVTLDKKDRDKQKFDLMQGVFKDLAENDYKKATAMKDIRIESMRLDAERQKAMKDEMVTTGDTLSFTSGLRKEMSNDSVVQIADKVMTSYSAFDAAYKRSLEEGKILSRDPNATTRNASDQAMIVMFNKLTDPASVVRESEYDRTPDGGTLSDKFTGLATKLAVTGGSGMTQKQREELAQVALDLKTAYEKTLQDRASYYFVDIASFNSQPNVQKKVDYKSFPLFKHVQLPQDTFDTWEGSYTGVPSSVNTSGTENPSGDLTFLSPENAPQGGYRTDRHNNPAAFTTAIAKQAGLVEGVDYVPGDPFSGGTTAKLLGDPVDQTIKVIDKIGFYTQNGKQRWTHTAISQKDWESKTYDQKAAIVAQMYQREGGTGVLLARSAPPDQYQSRSPIS